MPQGEEGEEVATMDDLVQFTIYDHPRDYPTGYVVRRWIIRPRNAVADAATFHRTLDRAREAIPPGLVRIMRAPDDDPCIVETWT